MTNNRYRHLTGTPNQRVDEPREPGELEVGRSAAIVLPGKVARSAIARY
jgi:hypothetical protein